MSETKTNAPLPTSLNGSSIYEATKSFYTPNPLNDFEQVAYHFKLLVNGDNVNSVPNGMQENPIIIAETGVTGFNIKSVHIEAIVAPNKVTRNSFATSFEITIVENGSCGFLDTWVRACDASNVSNYEKAQYQLELSFKGYNADGTYANFASLGTWKYRIMVTNCSMHTSETGTIYVLTAVPYNDTAMENEKIRFPHNVEIKGNTVKEIIDNMAKEANAIVKTRYGDQVFNYSFDCGDCGGFTFSDIVNDNKQNWKWLSFDKDDPKKPRINIMKGMALLDVVNNILSALTEAQRMAKTDPSKPTKDNSIPDGVRTIYDIYPEVTMKEYWFFNGFYKQDIKYYIKSYTTSKARLPNDGIADSAKTLEWCKKNLKKQYNYYFTGKNTEVISFDVKTNFAWALAVPRYNGNIREGVATENAPIHSRDSSKFCLQTDSANALMMQKNETQADVQRAMRGEKVLGSSVIANFTLAQNTTANNTALAAQEKGQAARLARWTNPSSARYAEEIPPITNPTIASWVQSEFTAGNTAGIGTTPINEPSKTMYGAIMSQIFSPQMVNIDMTVRGDPFWLGQFDAFSYATETKAKEVMDGSHAKFSDSDVCLALIFKMPTTDSSGNITYNNSDVFDGIYNVNKITHNFENGEFRQILHASRNPYITSSDARVVK